MRELRKVILYDREDQRYLVMFSFFSLSLTYLHYYWIDNPYSAQRWALHQEIMQHTALSPYRYRILIPLLAEKIAKIATWITGLEFRKAVLGGYILITFLSLFAGLVLFQSHLRRWFERRQALVGSLFLASMMPLTFIHYYFQPTSHPEFVSFVLGMRLIIDRRHGWLWLLLALSTLNRETSIFLVFLYWVCNLGLMRPVRLFSWTCLYGLTWVSIYGGLRLFLGMAPHIGLERPNLWSYYIIYNLTTWDTYLTVGAFFGVFWWLAFHNPAKKPLALRRGLWFVPVFFLVHLTLSQIHEVRYFLELCPIIVPLALMSLFDLSSHSG